MKQIKWKINVILSLLLASYNVFSQTSWQWVNPNPYMYMTNDIAKTGSNTFLMVGDNGYIFRTSDRGANWNSVYDPNFVHYDLNSVLFTDFNTAYVCGDSGTILKSTDNGISWTRLLISDDNDLHGSFFINQNTGYATGYQTILKTTDAGVSWNIVSDTSLFSGRYIKKPFFININTGWVVGASFPPHEQLYKTTNGGLSWQLQFGINEIANYQFCNETTGYISANTGFYIYKSRIYKTTNGGSDWYPNEWADSNWVISDLYFSNENTGYVINGKIHKTTNGGLSWSKDSINFSYNATKLYDDAFFIYDIWDLRISTNQGLKWDKLKKGFNETFFGISFLNSSTGIVNAGHNGLLKTTNAGLNWNYLDTISHISFNKIVYNGEMNLFAIAYQYDTVYNSIDGGLHWSSKKIGDSLTLDDILYVNKNSIYIAAEKVFGFNYFYKSTDNGATWLNHILDSADGYSEIRFFDTDNGYYKSARRLFKTRDGGATWDEILYNSERNFRFDNFDFRDINTGWVTHMSGNVYMTTNAGMNWLIRDISNYYIWGTSDLKIFNKDTGIIFRTDSYIYTTNNGLVWNYRYLPSSEVYSYDFVDDQHFWASGSNGKILKSTDGLGFYNESNEIIPPFSFFLFQNYPNPFNPATSFKYEVPNTGLTTLKLYDILGREVRTIVNDVNTAGIHVVEESFNDLASGIYFIKLVQGQYVQSRKIVLIK